MPDPRTGAPTCPARFAACAQRVRCHRLESESRRENPIIAGSSLAGVAKSRDHTSRPAGAGTPTAGGPALSVCLFAQLRLRLEVRKEEISVVALLPVDAAVRFLELLLHDLQHGVGLHRPIVTLIFDRGEQHPSKFSASSSSAIAWRWPSVCASAASESAGRVRSLRPSARRAYSTRPLHGPANRRLDLHLQTPFLRFS